MTDTRKEFADTLKEIKQLEQKLARLMSKAFKLEAALMAEEKENDE